jgi:hypothetical protein
MQMFPQNGMRDEEWEGLHKALSLDPILVKESKKKKKPDSKKPDAKDISQSDKDSVRKILQSQFPDLFQIWNKGAWGKEILTQVLRSLAKENIWNVKKLLDTAEKM